ncbi:MAG: endolytic transglycosylase MltG [Geobacteraceae bacterium]|nr:endolytic transglycosylase MltG [Geobacteraceae bacterium]
MIIIPKNRKLLLSIIAAACILLLLPAGFGLFVATPAGDGRNVRLFDFAEGASLRRLAGELENGGIISSARLFVLYARLRGADAVVKAGTYQFDDGLAPAEILRRMVAGEIFASRFAVPEGYSVYQVAELLESRGLFKKEAFLKHCFNRTLLKELGIGGKSVEGYLYPSTYTIPPTMDEAELIRMMVAQFDKVYGQRFAERAKSLGASTREVVTLASMIEKEAVVPAERPLIASVFRNRLNRGMPLQSDPTAVYGVRAFAGKVSKQDIMRSTPYNTYLIKGLPPGPVGSPGSEAMEAVITPAATGYLYFVARQDGTHHFSATLEEHNRAVRKYLR